MAKSEWTDARTRMPEDSDCGPNGRIIVWHRLNGAMIANRSQLRENRYMSWWMPYPDEPDGAEINTAEMIPPPEYRL